MGIALVEENCLALPSGSPPKPGQSMDTNTGHLACGRQSGSLIPRPVNVLGYMARGSKVANQLMFRCRDCPGSFGWAQCNHKAPYK